MRFLSLFLAALFLASCKTAPKPVEPGPPGDATVKAAADGMVPGQDVAAVNTFFKTNKTNSMIPKADQTPVITAVNSFFVVDLDGQRVYFYHDQKLLAASALASGRKYYRTETGDYTVGQKNLNHRSNSYGNFVSKSGGTLVSDVKNGFDPTPVGGRFQGSLMKYFMRFNHKGSPTAMGFHRGVLPGHPASHGCVRLPDRAAAWFFSKVPAGTPIYVRGSKYGVPYGKSQGRPKRSPKIHSSLKNQPVSTTPADPGAESTSPVPAPAPSGDSPAPAVDPPVSSAVEPGPAPAGPDPAPPAPAPGASGP